jgi:hypothetical protein
MAVDVSPSGELTPVVARPLKIVAAVTLLVTVCFVAFAPTTPFAPIAGVLAAALGIWGRIRSPWWGYTVLAVVAVAVVAVGVTVDFLLGTQTAATFG